MECTGKIKDISFALETNQLNLTLSINEKNAISEIKKLNEWLNEDNKDNEDRKLSIKIVKYRKKRSLDANAYLWVICTKLAEVHQTSKDEIYEEMLQKYGVLYQDEDENYVIVTLKADIDTSKLEGHWKYYRSSEDGKFKSYLMIKGTSSYNTSEMAHFIDMVVQEAKDEGIETLSPNELERMMRQYENSISKQ